MLSERSQAQKNMLDDSMIGNVQNRQTPETKSRFVTTGKGTEKKNKE